MRIIIDFQYFHYNFQCFNITFTIYIIQIQKIKSMYDIPSSLDNRKVTDFSRIYDELGANPPINETLSVLERKKLKSTNNLISEKPSNRI